MSWTTGEATIRHSLIMQLDLAARVSEQIGIVSDQYARLKAGLPVVVERAELQQFGHSRMPANLGAYAQWSLGVDDALTPVVG